MYTDIVFNNAQSIIINIYVSNVLPERVVFFNDMNPHCLTFEQIIILGNFNCIVNPSFYKICSNGWK